METCSLKVEELLSEEHWHKQCIEAYSKWAEYSTGKGAQQQLPRWLPLASSTQYGPIVLESHFQDEGSLFCKMVGPWTLHQETFSTSLKSEYSFFSIKSVSDFLFRLTYPPALLLIVVNSMSSHHLLCFLTSIPTRTLSFLQLHPFALRASLLLESSRLSNLVH